MLELLLIRHAKTAGNEEGLYIGSTDQRLSDLGKREILSCQYQRDYPVEQVFSSPLLRCVETASSLFPDLNIQQVADLRECDFGVFEGKNYEQLKDDPDYRNWIASAGACPPPGGEEREAFLQRTQKAFEEIVEELISHSRLVAAVVAHGGSIMAILERFSLEKQPFYHWQLKNCEGYLVGIDSNIWQQQKKVLVKKKFSLEGDRA